MKSSNCRFAPSSIRVSIANLQIGDVIHIRDVILPPGVAIKEDADAVVVQVTVAVAEEAVAAPAAESAEPEIIGKVKEAEEEEEKK
jgi:large subunit ribosomal protein L25